MLVCLCHDCGHYCIHMSGKRISKGLNNFVSFVRSLAAMGSSHRGCHRYLVRAHHCYHHRAAWRCAQAHECAGQRTWGTCNRHAAELRGEIAVGEQESVLEYKQSERRRAGQRTRGTCYCSMHVLLVNAREARTIDMLLKCGVRLLCEDCWVLRSLCLYVQSNGHVNLSNWSAKNEARTWVAPQRGDIAQAGQRMEHCFG